jgi:regulatory protein YycI of two-component signal transduction system YycFG
MKSATFIFSRICYTNHLVVLRWRMERVISSRQVTHDDCKGDDEEDDVSSCVLAWSWLYINVSLKRGNKFRNTQQKCNNL